MYEKLGFYQNFQTYSRSNTVETIGVNKCHTYNHVWTWKLYTSLQAMYLWDSLHYAYLRSSYSETFPMQTSLKLSYRYAFKPTQTHST